MNLRASVGITAVRGLRVGHCTDARRPTGCTVVLACDGDGQGAVAGVDVRGASPGTRETDLLSPLNAVEKVHAVVLAGGSAFGLDAASGVMRWLEAHGFGLEVRPGIRVPIVPAAILFDLSIGDPLVRPDADAGYAACEGASERPVAEGNVGAGAGASVGKLFGIERAMKGGLGTASITVDGITVAALVAVNAIGDIVDPASGRIVAGARSIDGATLFDSMAALRRGDWPGAAGPGTATSIAVVATDAVITKAAANKIAQMAHDGLARTINPVHTMGDGDVVFALGTGASGKTVHTTWLGALAADMLAEAVLRGVRAARRIGATEQAREQRVPHLPAAFDLGSPDDA